MKETAPPDQAKTTQGPSTDPLAALHKMSRTAGLGSQEYVAVNPTAVIAFLLGLASSAAVLGNILLIIPVATLVVAILAIIQIRNSAGTQSGLLLAGLGLGLAAAFVIVVGGRAILHAQRVSAERDEIVALIDQLGKNVSQANYDAAWAQFSPRFQERIKRETFQNLWTTNQASPYYGQINLMRWNGILDVQIDPETGATTAQGVIIIELKNGQYDRRLGVFRKDPAKGWAFDDINGYFAPEPPQQQQQTGP